MKKLRLRWFNRLYAGFFGYFWIPCPVCQEPFGGHEVLDDSASIVRLTNHGIIRRVVCPKDSCQEFARKLNPPYWKRRGHDE